MEYNYNISWKATWNMKLEQRGPLDVIEGYCPSRHLQMFYQKSRTEKLFAIWAKSFINY